MENKTDSYNLRGNLTALKRKNLFRDSWIKNVMRCLSLDERTATELYNRILQKREREQ